MKKRTLTEEIAKMKTMMNVMGEVSDETYNKILSDYSSARLIMSDKDSIEFKPTPNQEISFKPKGLWYGIGDSWIRWVRSEMPDWEADNVFKIDINEDRILKITNYKELVAFEEKYNAMRPEDRTVTSYSIMMASRYKSIDWSLVAKDYAGIEIAPYIYKARYDHMWYYGWDVASGCIWGDGAITNITKLNNEVTSVDEMVTKTRVICDDCGWSWKKSEGGDDMYICHKCGCDNDPNKQPLDEYIRKIGDDKWRVYSEKGGNLGTYNSESGAKERLQQIHYFKNKK
jgi:hypothetical protein